MIDISLHLYYCWKKMFNFKKLRKCNSAVKNIKTTWNFKYILWFIYITVCWKNISIRSVLICRKTIIFFLLKPCFSDFFNKYIFFFLFLMESLKVFIKKFKVHNVEYNLHTYITEMFWGKILHSALWVLKTNTVCL